MNREVLQTFLKLIDWNYSFFMSLLSTNGDISVDIIAMNINDEKTAELIIPALSASCATTSSVSPFAFIAQPVIHPSFQLCFVM